MARPRAIEATAFARVVALEQALDRQLRGHPAGQAFDDRFRTAADEWSAEVWQAAQALGPADLDPAEISRGLALAQQPAFVCGTPRSGTTLLRDLLDGHRQLVVLPAESQFYTLRERALFGMPRDRHCAYLCQAWLRQLIDHPPYWLLGRSRPGESPYVAFARRFAGWWEIGEHESSARTSSWPLASFALAYAQHLGGGHMPENTRLWVEKSPLSEGYIERILSDFPAAKILHIVREPAAVLASFKAAKRGQWSRSQAATMTLRHLATGYRIAAGRAGAPTDGGYRLIRYEELVADPGRTMDTVAEFLGIDRWRSTPKPTIAGVAAVNNSSFAGGRPRAEGALTRLERILLAAAVGPWARRLGY